VADTIVVEIVVAIVTVGPILPPINN
jgi:hypothetical protein